MRRTGHGANMKDVLRARVTGAERCPECSGDGVVACCPPYDGCPQCADGEPLCSTCKGVGLVRMRRAEDLLRLMLRESTDGVGSPSWLTRKKAAAFLAWVERDHFPNYPLGSMCDECGHEDHATDPCGAPVGDRQPYETCTCRKETTTT